jgi:DNA-binding NarL/FixJ family response regulator
VGYVFDSELEKNFVNSQDSAISRKRLLLADDQTVVLQEVRSLLAGDYDIVAEVTNGKQLVEAVQQLNPDLIVSDISMPELNGFEAAARIRALGIDTKLIFLTVQSTPAYVRKARSLGAAGYVLKVYAMEQLPTAVSAVLAGRTYVSPELETSWKQAGPAKN